VLALAVAGALAPLVALLSTTAAFLALGVIRLQDRQEATGYRQCRQHTQQPAAGITCAHHPGQGIEMGLVHAWSLPGDGPAARRARLGREFTASMSLVTHLLH
jgi:hypothetical protein